MPCPLLSDSGRNRFGIGSESGRNRVGNGRNRVIGSESVRNRFGIGSESGRGMGIGSESGRNRGLSGIPKTEKKMCHRTLFDLSHFRVKCVRKISSAAVEPPVAALPLRCSKPDLSKGWGSSCPTLRWLRRIVVSPLLAHLLRHCLGV